MLKMEFNELPLVYITVRMIYLSLILTQFSLFVSQRLLRLRILPPIVPLRLTDVFRKYFNKEEYVYAQSPLRYVHHYGVQSNRSRTHNYIKYRNMLFQMIYVLISSNIARNFLYYNLLCLRRRHQHRQQLPSSNVY